MSEISFVIVSWNTCQLLRNCLHSIMRAAGELTHEIIVVDNRSMDGSPQMVEQEFPQVRLIRNQDNLGFPHGVNQGLRASVSQFIFLLNSDVELLPETLPQLRPVMAQHPNAGIVGCAHRRPDGTEVIAFYDDPTLPRELMRNLFLTDYLTFRVRRERVLAKYREPTPVEWVMGAAMFVRHEMIDTVGLLDENVFMYGEEFDWCYRARQKGWQVYYVPTARILHYENQSGMQLYNTRRYSAVTQSLFYFYDKHFGVRQRRILAGLHVCGSLLRILAMSAFGLVALDRARVRAEISEHSQVLRVAWKHLFTRSMVE